MGKNGPIIDLQQVTCGLVPAIISELEKQPGDVVRVLVRQGIRTELWNSFGSGGDWEITMEDGLFHDVLIFRRSIEKSLDPLNLMDF